MNARIRTFGPTPDRRDERSSRPLRVAAWIKTGVLGMFAAALVWVAATQTGAAEQEMRVVDQPSHAAFTDQLAHRWPSCVATARFPGREIPAFVLVQSFTEPTAPVRPQSFDVTWALNRNDTTRDDVWWVAKCRGDQS